ncbi:hypothetical protein ACWG0P_07305 [Amedibacillus sp. YH-ame6]
MKFETLKQQVLEALQHGSENAIDRYELARRLNTDERMIRRVVVSLIDEDEVPICSSSSYKGYFLPSSVDEVIHAKNERIKRAKSTFKCIATYNKYIREQTQEKMDL